jgi:phospholipase C
LNVYFETGIGSFGILDYWSVKLSVMNGSAPGQYINTGTLVDPNWKECQLQSGDVDKNMVFTVSTSQFVTNLASGGCTDGMKFVAPYTPITNVFVVMLENRSFDHMFGRSGIPGLRVAPAGASNSYKNESYPVASPAPTSMPTDPGHEFLDVLEQLAGPGAAYPKGGPYPPINNSGFVANYATTTTEGPLPAPGDLGDVMLAYDTPSQLPVIYQLATEFATCDQWFASMPGPTWPNRFFVHGASSNGFDHSPTSGEIIGWMLPGGGFAYPNGSIFQHLTTAGMQWRIYNDDTDAYSDDPQNGSFFGKFPQVAALQGVTYMVNTNSLTNLASDLRAPYPYQYTFIEPNYGDVTGNTYRGGSSQHPMDDVYGGENLIKAVYEAIRNSPIWNSSLLVITYDEHGGFYDSAAPGPAPAPQDNSASSWNESGFAFNQYGVRVPAIVVSPLIPKATVDHTLYDHSSIPATVERLFGSPSKPIGPLTQRDANANDVIHLLALQTPRTDCPVQLNSPAPPAAKAPISAAEQAANDARPVPTSGNAAGFLSLALKTDLDLSLGSEADKAATLDNFSRIQTQGEARAYAESVLAKAAAATATARR